MRLCKFKILSVVLVFRLQVGGQAVTPWTLYSDTEMRQHGLWCQVNNASNAGVGSDIGDMFYSTGNGPDGFTVVPTNESGNSVPYQQFKCTNQIGVVVDGVLTNFQGFLKCNTTIPNLNTNTHYSVMYQQSVINIYSKLYMCCILKMICMHVSMFCP